MFRKVLVGYLDAERGVDALALGRILTSACGGTMEVATAPGPDGEGLGRIARSRGADLLVLGSSNRAGIGKVIPGSTVDRLLADPPCAIAVAPPGFGQPADGKSGWQPLDGNGDDSGMRVIGVGYDASEASGIALDVATQLALRNSSSLRVYTVAPQYPNQAVAAGIPLTPGGPSEVEVLRDALQRAVHELPPEVRALPVFLRGFEADQLDKATMLGVDLLVLGARPGGPMRRHLHRSVSNLVLNTTRCPVLIIPASVAAAVSAPA